MRRGLLVFAALALAACADPAADSTPAATTTAASAVSSAPVVSDSAVTPPSKLATACSAMLATDHALTRDLLGLTIPTTTSKVGAWVVFYSASLDVLAANIAVVRPVLMTLTDSSNGQHLVSLAEARIAQAKATVASATTVDDALKAFEIYRAKADFTFKDFPKLSAELEPTDPCPAAMAAHDGITLCAGTDVTTCAALPKQP